MMEEQWMRGWTHSHERLSADLDRGFKWLGRAFGRFVDLVAPGHAPGEDVFFVASTRATAKSPVRVRAARRR